jgi:Sulfotransferase family
VRCVTIDVDVAQTPELRRTWRELRVGRLPPLPGLAARWWSPVAAGLRGFYLFHEARAAEAFATAAGDRGDPGVRAILSHARASRVAASRPVEIEQSSLDRPVFVVSAPRAGSTLLYDLLARSDHLWSIGGEAHGPIEGIPALGLAGRSYESHCLAERDATADVADTLRYSLVAAAAGDPRDRRLVEKTPENAFRIPFLRAVFPDAHFVWLLREPEANVSSIVEAWAHDEFVTVPDLPGWEGDDWHLVLPPGWRRLRGQDVSQIAAHQWSSATAAIMAGLARLPDHSWSAVRYEHLVDRPAEVVGTLCRRMDVPFEGALRRAVAQPLRVAPTALSQPSPHKWRFNSRFDRRSLQAHDGVIARAAAASSRAHTRGANGHVRFRCFLDELEGLAGPSIGNGSGEVPDDLVVADSFVLQLGTTIPLSLVRRARFRERFLADYPLAWVEDPTSGTLRPFWVDGRAAWRLANLQRGFAPPPEVDVPLRRQLAAAGILISPTPPPGRGDGGEEQAVTAHSHFAEEGWCLLRDLLHPGHVGALRRYYRSLIATGSWQLGDAQVAGRYGWHNEPLARFFHHQLASYVSRVAGERVRPTYVYVSAYQPGAVLDRHLDREQCKYTMSLAIDESPEEADFKWPLHFDTPAGTVSVTQVLGDAVLFRGNELPHYRHRLPEGHTATALLFHFVPDSFVGTHY